MNIITDSPWIKDVPGAVTARVTITEVPCGTCYTTAFFDVLDQLVRQDQHIDAHRAFEASGTVQL